MKTVADFVEGHDETLPRLPLMHCCDSASLRQIILSGKLVCSPCSVFKGDNLLYFFYGVPSYKPNEDMLSETHPAFNPVIFVLEPEAVKEITRIFPFDTGAYEAGRYDKVLYKPQKIGSNAPGMSIYDFALNAKIETPAKAITAFFGGDLNAYLSGQPGKLEDDKIGALDLELHSLSYLYQERGRLDHDDRSCKIEIQVNQDLTLDRSNVAAIACPAIYGDDPDFSDAVLHTWGATLLPYSFPIGTPLQKAERARLVVEQYLEGLLK